MPEKEWSPHPWPEWTDQDDEIVDLFNGDEGDESDVQSLIDDIIASQRQVGGTHYRRLEIQPWDYMKCIMTDPEFVHGYLAGNVIKYMSRYTYKNGVEDLKKARHYLDKMIEELEE